MSNRKIKWLRDDKDLLVQKYLETTGADVCRPSEFIDFIESRQDHPLWELLFSRGDAYHARSHRIDLVRDWLRGVRTVSVQTLADPGRSVVVSVKSYVSRTDDRVSGGGYETTDSLADDPSMQIELLRQAGRELESLLKRHAGIFQVFDIDAGGAQQLLETIQTKHGG